MPESTQARLQKVEQQIEEKKKLRAQLKAKERSQKRKDETRRKILIGAAVEALNKNKKGGIWIEDSNGERTARDTDEVLDLFIKSKADRKFLKLDN